MSCKSCNGKLALRLLDVVEYPIDNLTVVVNDVQWYDETEVYCKDCGEIQSYVTITYDDNGVPVSVKQR